MHVNGNTEDTRQGDEIRADVAVAHHAVVRAPVVHHRVDIAEGALVREAWNEPSRRPSRICALLESFVGFRWQLDRLAFGDLEGGSDAIDEVESEDRRRHSASGDVACAPAASWEILGDRRMPCRRLQAGFHFGWGDIPEWLHGWLAVDGLFAAAVEGRWAGIDEVQEAVCGGSLWRFARNALDGLGAPVSAEIRKNLSGIGEQMPEKHGHAIEGIVFRRNNVWCAAAIPIERRIKNSLHEISIRHVVGPLALALESSADGVMALCFLAEALLGQLGISDHEVTGDEGGLDRDFPFLVELLAAAFLAGGVPIFALGAIRFHPLEGLFQLSLVVDPALDATNEFRHVHGLDAHAEPFFK